ncbi:MAG TPA: hypothetical protein VM345_15935 [Acidimicrobiales bacterium]|nr:hypothetical protein [Acidimicrobiales bacterium]
MAELRTIIWSELRYRLTLALVESGRPMSIPDLLDALASEGLVPAGARPGKEVSDALRRARRQGWVVRRSRGVYAAGRVPRSSMHFVRRALAEIDDWHARQPSRAP